MRKTRFMTWFFLSLSLALFCVRGFRPALEAPFAALLPFGWTGEFGAAEAIRGDEWAREETSLQVSLLALGTGPILERFFSLRRYVTPAQLRQMAYDAEPAGNTDLIAFAALQLPKPAMCKDVLHLADRVVSANPKLTWLVYYAAADCAPDWRSGPSVKDWEAQVEKFEAWDPENAVPHILRGNMIRFGEGWKWEGAATDTARIPKVLGQRLEWQKQMEAAFARPRFESYILPRLELERRVMVAQGWTHPLVMAYAIGNPRPSISSVSYYATHILEKMGAEAEAEGRMEEALQNYRIEARFGERLRLQGHTELERIIGIGLQRDAYERLVPALKKAGKADEAAEVEYAQKQMTIEFDRFRGDPRSRTSTRAWAVLLASIAGSAVWVFLFLSLASVFYVNTRLLIRRDKKGRLYQVMTILENYAPLMLFSSCLALGLIYAPFAQNFSSYLAGSERPISWYEFMGNSFPTPRSLDLGYDLPVENPYHGFVTYALVIAGLMLVIGIVRSRLAGRKESV